MIRSVLVKRWLYPLGLTLLAAFLRWHDLDAARLLWDHSYSIAEAQRLLLFGEFPLIGQKSTLFLSNPPGHTYVTTLLWLGFGSTWLIFWCFASLNLLAVPALYSFVKRFQGQHTALIATLLYAASPWVNLYSRMTWANALVPSMTVWVLGFTLSAVSTAAVRRRVWSAAAALGCLTLLGQEYLFAFILLPIQMGSIFLTRLKQIPWKGVLYGGAVFGAGAVYYGVTLIGQWREQAARFNTFTQGGSAPNFKLLATQLAVRYITGESYYLANTLNTSLPTPLNFFDLATQLILGLALAGGIVYALRQIFQRAPQAWLNVALLLWWFIPIAALSYNNQPIHHWHLTLSLPAGHWLTAQGLTWATQQTPKFRRVWQVAALGLLVFWFALINSVNQFIAAHPMQLSFDEMPLSTGLTLGAKLNRLTQHYQTNEVYLQLNSVVPSALAGKPLTAVSWFDEKNLLILPQERPALYVRLGRTAPPEPFALGERLELITLPDQSTLAFDLLPALTRDQMAKLPQTKIDWRNETGLSLLGYTLDGEFAPSKTITVLTYWFIDELVETRGNYIFAPYLHFESPDGKIKLNEGAPGLPGYTYRLGDLYIQPISVTLPPNAPRGNYYFELGLYDGLHQKGTTFFPPSETPQPFYATNYAIR